MGSGKRGSDYILQKHEGIKSMEYIEIKACAMNLKIHFNRKMTTLRDFLDKVMELWNGWGDSSDGYLSYPLASRRKHIARSWTGNLCSHAC
jgi:hypothetical protein